jgi:hypothetical protein
MSDELWRVCGLKREALCGNHAAYAMRIHLCAQGYVRVMALGAVALVS